MVKLVDYMIRHLVAGFPVGDGLGASIKCSGNVSKGGNPFIVHY